MNEIRFYHLQRSRLEDALPQLLERTLAKGWRAVVRVGSAERVEQLNAHLWTYNENSFLPHGSSKEGDAPHQPVWLTSEDDNPNKADVLMLVDGAAFPSDHNFDLICVIFDGNDPDATHQTRSLWKQLQPQKHALTYWKQTDSGWEKQAIS